MGILVFNNLQVQLPPDLLGQLKDSSKLLGVTVDRALNFNDHINNIARKVSSGIFCLHSLRDWAGIDLLRNVYYALVQSHLNYCINVWGPFASETGIQRLLRLQKRALRTMTRKKRSFSCKELFKELGIMTLPSLIMYNSILYILQNKTVPTSRKNKHSLRENNMRVKRCTSAKEQKYVTNFGVKVYNKLPRGLRTIKSIKQFFIENSFYSINEFISG